MSVRITMEGVPISVATVRDFTTVLVQEDTLYREMEEFVKVYY